MGHSSKLDTKIHLTIHPKIRVRVSSSSVAIRLKYERNRFKEYIDAILEGGKVDRLVTSIVELGTDNPLPDAVVREIAGMFVKILEASDGKSSTVQELAKLASP